MTEIKKAAISAASVGNMEKIFNHASTTSKCMPRKAKHEPLARMPETNWVLSSPEGIERFYKYMNGPKNKTKEGAALMRMARERSEKRANKRKERLAMLKK